ncbi:hypothetical protein ATK36_4323 [Amycolatopsis sulphurea]|uniref:Uncharacterized protein n=1 Tax=Amycolatopsis sulphurea TaxID=76022 RepID=A0A2A9FFH6_9PSEU|nr:hypothetical protein ATK36_4323 [Amycolatopsis sulphurea]
MQVLLVHQPSVAHTFPANLSRIVGGQRYRDGVSKDGLTRLVVSLMVSGGVTAVDAAHPADAHAAVLRAVRLPGGEMLSRAFDTEVRTVPDPSVGLRVLGLTQALWRAVGRGWLEPRDGGGQALLVLSDAAAKDLAADLSQLDRSQGSAVRQAGDAWARDSTCLKNSVSAFASPASV